MQTSKLDSKRLVLAITVLVSALAFSAPGARAAGIESVILNVDGMWNENCEEYISDSLLGDIAGVGQVLADHEKNVVTVDFDPATSSAEEIAAAIEDCPYFDVTGSETHELDEALINENRRSCCDSDCPRRVV